VTRTLGHGEEIEGRFLSIQFWRTIAAPIRKYPAGARTNFHETSMGEKYTQIDAYIAKSADFAKPILNQLRHMIHTACPDVEETIKWGCPHFMYKGMLGGMAAFKQHCTFGFWHKKMRDTDAAKGKNNEAMGQFGRITNVKDLPNKVIFARLVRQAMKLNEAVNEPRKPAKKRQAKPLDIPTDLKAALGKNKKALATFENFSTSHRNEYVEWITEAKRDETRHKRLKTTIELLAAGKSRNWKYERK
jgi:uncharacterized protein YdeI (YjbR/CyaY-like superfamily)